MPVEGPTAAAPSVPIETREVVQAKTMPRPSEQALDTPAKSGGRLITVRDPGGDRVFTTYLSSAGISSEDLAAFMQLPLEVRLERWDAAARLIKEISYAEHRALEAKRDAAVIQAFQDESIRMTGPEAEATQLIMADPKRYAIARDPNDGSVFLVDLSTFEFDEHTTSRVAELEGRITKDRQALLRILRGN